MVLQIISLGLRLVMPIGWACSGRGLRRREKIEQDDVGLMLNCSPVVLDIAAFNKFFQHLCQLLFLHGLAKVIIHSCCKAFLTIAM
jgi:hypothetical protein